MSYYTLTGDPGWSGSYYTDESGTTISPQELVPNPDFFTSVLWKNLMGPIVLDVQYDKQSNPMLIGTSLHAHCATTLASTTPGAISLAFANPIESNVNIEDVMIKSLGVAGVQSRLEYFLTSGDPNDLSSRSVRLNSATELLTSSSNLDGSVGVGPLVLPASSYGFVVYPNAGAKACL